MSQIDRRVRDLRDYGWIILSNTEDASLMTREQRFVTTGVAVWDPKARRAAAPNNSLSTREIRAVLERDEYTCTVCGIAGGEEYPDDPTKTGVLSVSRRRTIHPGGEEELLLLTECKRCRAGDGGAPTRADTVASEISALDPADRRRLARWIELNRRVPTPLERAWSAYRRLPVDARGKIRSALDI
ncbi:hypothetical protein [Kribbella endophytica]